MPDIPGEFWQLPLGIVVLLLVSGGLGYLLIRQGKERAQYIEFIQGLVDKAEVDRTRHLEAWEEQSEAWREMCKEHNGSLKEVIERAVEATERSTDAAEQSADALKALAGAVKQLDRNEQLRFDASQAQRARIEAAVGGTGKAE